MSHYGQADHLPGKYGNVDIMDTFWKDKRVFLTGHTGFKGAWLSIWLNKLGANVTGFSLEPPTKPSLFEIASLHEKMKSLTGDIRDLSMLRKTLAVSRPDIVIHMAAQALVRESYKNPVETYATNVMGTVHILEAIREVSSVKAVVMVTSDKCYENRDMNRPFQEHEPMGGYDPYSNSKGCAELVIDAYRRSFFNGDAADSSLAAIASARAGNVIGGGDWAADRIIPDCMKALLENRKIVVRNPRATRPWQHVLEPLNGYLALAQKLYEKGKSFAEAWNFGPDEKDAVPVKSLVAQLCNQWNKNAEFIFSDSNGPHEAQYLKLDSTKARERLGWKPRWDITRALSSITAWYRAFQDNRDMHTFCQKQIEEYESAAGPAIEQHQEL